MARSGICLGPARQVLPLLLSAVFVATAPARAEDDPLTRSSFWNFQWENDLLARSHTDRHYTNGLRLSFLQREDGAPAWLLRISRSLPWFPEGGRVRAAWALGQNLYTPEDIEAEELVVDDRPYAAWLYASGGLVVENGRVLDITEISLGIVGPGAGGQTLQRWVHGTNKSPDPRGWQNQLPNEPALQLTWQRKWRQLAAAGDGLGFDLMPHLGGGLGNVFVYGAAGATARVGLDLAADYGPPRIGPSLPGSELFLGGNRSTSGYLFLGVEARGVLHNLFLDGSTFHDSHSVERRPFVLEAQAGLALRFRKVRVAYTYVFRTEEFEGQDGADRFGALTLSLAL